MWKRTAFLICDLQTKVLPHIKKSDRIIKNTRTLIDANTEYRKLHSSEHPPVIVAELLPKKLGHTIPEISKAVQNMRFNNYFLEKNTYSIFSKHLANLLREQEVDKILLSGVQTEWCIARTAEDFQKDGFDVVIASDAVGSSNEEEHRLALLDLRRRNIGISTTHSFIVNKLFHVDHPLSKWYVNYLKNRKYLRISENLEDINAVDRFD